MFSKSPRFSEEIEFKVNYNYHDSDRCSAVFIPYNILATWHHHKFCAYIKDQIPFLRPNQWRNKIAMTIFLHNFVLWHLSNIGTVTTMVHHCCTLHHFSANVQHWSNGIVQFDKRIAILNKSDFVVLFLHSSSLWFIIETMYQYWYGHGQSVLRWTVKSTWCRCTLYIYNGEISAKSY